MQGRRQPGRELRADVAMDDWQNEAKWKSVTISMHGPDRLLRELSAPKVVRLFWQNKADLLRLAVWQNKAE
jgi:hypothetical protein